MHIHGRNEDALVVPNCEEVAEMVAALESLPQHVGKPPIPIPIFVSTNKLLPSVIQAPSLELKPLPNHLKYCFLGRPRDFVGHSLFHTHGRRGGEIGEGVEGVQNSHWMDLGRH